MHTLRILGRLTAGVAITFAGLGAVGTFGLFAFIGMPMLAVGLGLLSSAVDDL